MPNPKHAAHIMLLMARMSRKLHRPDFWQYVDKAEFYLHEALHHTEQTTRLLGEVVVHHFPALEAA